MRSGGPVLAMAAVLLLAGCVYDPNTGTYVPCCNYYGYYGYPYGYPYGYHYPPPYYPYGGPPGPYGAPPPGQPGFNGPAPAQAPPVRPGATVNPGQGALTQRFAAANVTHDGRLTRAQAQAGMPMVARNFDTIDIDRKGYVTLPEIRSFTQQRRAERSQSGWSPRDAFGESQARAVRAAAPQRWNRFPNSPIGSA